MERQPVVTRAFIVAAVALVAAALGKAGVVVPKDVAANLVEVAAVIAPLALAYWARRHVTPVKDPRDADGNQLTPRLVPGGPVPTGSVVEIAPGDALDAEVTKMLRQKIREQGGGLR